MFLGADDTNGRLSERHRTIALDNEQPRRIAALALAEHSREVGWQIERERDRSTCRVPLETVANNGRPHVAGAPRFEDASVEVDNPV